MSLFSLEGRTALVTGASRGIGRALAAGLAEAGADLILAARSEDALQDTAAAVRAYGRQAHVYTADVSEPASIGGLFQKMDDAGLRADILINNAGMEEVRASVDVDEALWDRILDTNLKGAFFVARHFAERLLTAGFPGAIVNTCSLTSAVGVPTAVPYTASKTGLLGMTRALSSEWSPKGIRVNGIGPGYFRTELTEVFYQDDAWRAAMLAKNPMGRFGALEDLVGACVFLTAPASAYVTGQLVFVDGGYLASI
ncbi:MAG TPA: SDR family oxidoreductase [Kiloniellaceae bacterium]|nr:SDR family oxidoreductase [Kiloniellaceae bacterium]